MRRPPTYECDARPYRLIETGQITPIRLRRRVIFAESTLEAFIRNCSHNEARAGVLVSIDEARGRLVVRRMIGGIRRAVLHFQAQALLPQEPTQVAQRAHNPFSQSCLGQLGLLGRLPE
jgi:hypothetical protein